MPSFATAKHLGSLSLFALIALFTSGVRPAAAQTVTFASDNATAYSDFISRFNGSGSETVTQPNHGTGFNPFVFSETSTNFAGWYVGGNPGGGPSPVGSGPNAVAFTEYASTGSVTTATHSFNFSVDGVTPPVAGATTPLLATQTFSTDFRNRLVANDSSVGFSLADSAGTALFTFMFTGGTNDYSVTDSTGTHNNVLDNYTNGAINTTFTLTGANTFTFTASKPGGNNGSYSGTINGLIDRVVYFNNGAGNDADIQFNNLSITGPLTEAPEPSQAAALAIGMLGLAGLTLARRRQNPRLV